MIEIEIMLSALTGILCAVVILIIIAVISSICTFIVNADKKSNAKEMKYMSRIMKCAKILLLAMKLNNSPTKKSLTANKPTVFLSFSGHICSLEVEIFPHGWPADNIEIFTTGKIYLENTSKYIDENLDSCISKLSELCNEWCRK